MNYLMLDNIKNWHGRNVNKLILLSVVFISVSLVSAFILFFKIVDITQIANILSADVFIFTLFSYILFSPSTRIIVYSALGLLILGYALKIIELNFLAELTGEVLYYFLIIIFINLIKEVLQKEKVDSLNKN